MKSTIPPACSRLIEVALPIREISAESVRDKYIPSLHPKHIHVWWARRPLAAARAVVFASLVPDPDDPDCPKTFVTAVDRLLRTEVPPQLRVIQRNRTALKDPDPYKPYPGLEDTSRNRLLTFIAKWSPEALAFELGKSDKEPDPKMLLDDRCLVKWETSDPSSETGVAVLSVAKQLLDACGSLNTSLLDPFAGGGTIPLEAMRLGLKAVANDYNPVAYLVLKATAEYPVRFGIKGSRVVHSDMLTQGLSQKTTVPNTLVHDVREHATRILSAIRARLGHFYPSEPDGRPLMAYIWARTIPCPNPQCKCEIPLIRSLVLSSDASRRVALVMTPDRRSKRVEFNIATGSSIHRTEGTKKQRGPAECLFCEQPASEDDIRAAAMRGEMRERPIAAVSDGAQGKIYRAIRDTDIEAYASASSLAIGRPNEYIVPEINGPAAAPNAGSHRSISLELYGITQWGQLFNDRQLAMLNVLTEAVRDSKAAIAQESSDPEYVTAVMTYLGLWVGRIAMFSNTLCRWESGLQRPKTPFGGQAVPMMWDYPEINPFGTLAGTAETQLDYMLKAVSRQSLTRGEQPTKVTLGSATNLPLGDQSVACIVTDPPYGNSIAYADLSDFFYVWLKRCLADAAPEAFITPQTPKEQEATSHKHRHQGSQNVANEHYRKLLTSSFADMRRVSKKPELITVMFAHQTTEAWEALLGALFDAGLSPTATWPIATEMPTTALAMGTASLETSVTVVCRPRVAGKAAAFKDVKREVDEIVRQSVARFWSYGFRGADLIVACYGPAVGVFGQHERVERADGTPVKIPELLQLARIAARDAIAGEFRGDNLSTLYYVWATLYGASEQSWDDARLVVQVGGDADNAMEMARSHGLFIIDGSSCRLSLLTDRATRRGLGVDASAPLIDMLHRAMMLWKQEKRSDLVAYLSQRDLFEHPRYWKLAQALFEVLARDTEDWKLVSALLSERETLRTEGKRETAQTQLFRDSK